MISAEDFLADIDFWRSNPQIGELENIADVFANNSLLVGLDADQIGPVVDGAAALLEGLRQARYLFALTHHVQQVAEVRNLLLGVVNKLVSIFEEHGDYVHPLADGEGVARTSLTACAFTAVDTSSAMPGANVLKRLIAIAPQLLSDYETMIAFRLEAAVLLAEDQQAEQDFDGFFETMLVAHGLLPSYSFNPDYEDLAVKVAASFGSTGFEPVNSSVETNRNALVTIELFIDTISSMNAILATKRSPGSLLRV